MRTIAVDPKRGAKPCCRGLLSVRGGDIVCADCGWVFEWVEVVFWAEDHGHDGWHIAVADGRIVGRVMVASESHPLMDIPVGECLALFGNAVDRVAVHCKTLGEAKQYVEEKFAQQVTR